MDVLAQIRNEERLVLCEELTSVSMGACSMLVNEINICIRRSTYLAALALASSESFLSLSFSLSSSSSLSSSPELESEHLHGELA